MIYLHAIEMCVAVGIWLQATSSSELRTNTYTRKRFDWILQTYQ